MQSSLISKIEKARIYAEQADRFHLTALSCEVRGDSTTHIVTLGEDGWGCDCFFFQDAGTCSHVMAIERHFERYLPEIYRPVVVSA